MKNRVAPFVIVLLVLVAGLASSCAHEPPPDPRAGDRARLEALAKAPLDDAFKAEARLVLSPALMGREVQQTLDDAAATIEALRFTVPIVGEVALRPQVKVTSVRAEPEPACAACVALFVELDGAVHPQTGGGLLPGVAFTGAARGVFSLDIVDNAKAKVMEVRAIAVSGPVGAGARAAGREGWSAKVDVKDLPPGLSQSISDSVSDFIQRLMEGEARPELLLASLPKDGPVKLRGARPGAYEGAVTVDLAFVALDAGVVSGALPQVTSGYALQLPEQTLLSLIRTETLRTPPQAGYAVDATGLRGDGERFELELAVFHLKGDVSRRDVKVQGTFSLDGDELKLTPEKAVQTAHSGGFDPFGFIVEVALLKRVEQALQVAVPVAQSAPVGGRTRTARLTGLRDLGAVIQLDGVVE